MDSSFDQAPRCTAAGVTTGSTLAVIVAMAISVVVDIQPVATSPNTTTAAATVSARG